MARQTSQSGKKNNGSVSVSREDKKQKILFFCVVLFVFFFAAYIWITNDKGLFGYQVIYWGYLIPLFMILTSVVYVISFLAAGRSCRNHVLYMILALFLPLLCIIPAVYGVGCVRDIVQGPREVITEYYDIEENGIRIYTQTERDGLVLTDAQTEELLANIPHISEEKKMVLDDQMNIHAYERKIVVLYYPYSNRIKEIAYEESAGAEE